MRELPRALRVAVSVVAGPIASAVLWSCMASAPPPSPAAMAAMTQQLFGGEMSLAREALQRHEWVAAQGHYQGVAEALPANDPMGAEARAGEAEIAFELGQYALAAQTAASVPVTSQFASKALETRGLAQLFSCDFDGATQTFYQLVQVNPASGLTWLGMTEAWTGEDANAHRELAKVVAQYGSSEDGPNARFYLAQLALWGRHAGPAQNELSELNAVNPGYLPDLENRAQNWLQRRTHLMRAYFTFDTLSRLDRMTGSPSTGVDDQNARTALGLLQQTPGACASQVQRLAAAAAHASDLADRGAVVAPPTDETPRVDPHAAIALVGNQIQFQNGFSINFAFGQDAVSNDSMPVIDQLVQLLGNPRYAWIHKIRLDGHTDNAGDPAANMALSERRVHRVGAMLVARGVDVSRLAFGWYGDTRPIDPTNTDAARALNRRVEIFVIDPPMFGGVRATP